MIYKNRIIRLPEHKSVFLLGVRGSGKTALLRRRFPEALFIDLLDTSLFHSYLSDIGLFYKTVNAFDDKGLVIVDEIQRMPELLNEVHRLIESSRRRFILTGSSARKLKQKNINLLGGRAGKMFLHPFAPEELGEDFNLSHALRYGLIPAVWSAPDREDKLKDYIELYLKEEIKDEALTRRLPAFSRFLEIAGLHHGQAVNMSNIAREAQISMHYVREFFAVLEDTMTCFFLPAYRSQLKMREQKKSKFYLIDPGLARGMKRNFGPVSAEERGLLFEGLIAQLLRVYEERLYESVYYWSSLENKGTEVDFVLKKGAELTAIEVKAKGHISPQDCKGLRAIQRLPSVKRRIVVYIGAARMKTEDNIEIWPFEFFLQSLKKGF